MPLVENSGDRFFETKTRDYNQPEWTLRGDHTLKQKHH